MCYKHFPPLLFYPNVSEGETAHAKIRFTAVNAQKAS